ncbi:hypothetical protein SAMN04488134_10337 [Amphibacillus marinus]|uniref:NUDIX domain-containing protein n=1 Tax=Amphibacillus marinus TaxID=872970 RepID=A0A1H8L0P4_9BACI|nr:hypothetical protein SAMN04488134_10337 [Amphibacillus marinus]
MILQIENTKKTTDSQGAIKMTKKDIHVVSAVIVKDSKILCAQRNAHKALSYKWEFPGGKIELNEHLRKH